MFQIGSDFTFVHFNTPQSVMILALIFLSMVCNFGFLLMAMDRLRNEVADLALMDDLTGVGNRRQLLQRLTEECARSDRSNQPFALLVVDLDNFKTINDTHGHAAGDACLQHFTLMAQTRLRPGDLLARTGGDEFCIMLPASTLREAAMIARRIVEVCREDAAGCAGTEIPLSVSIGVAQWTREIGALPDRLIAAADHALYVAKKEGRNRYAVYEPAPPLAPEHEAALQQPLSAATREAPHASMQLDLRRPGGVVRYMPLRLLLSASGAGAAPVLCSGSGRGTFDIEAIARSSGTPDIPGLKMVWLAPWGDVAKAHPWRNIIVHQTEGPAGSARGGAQEQSKNPTRRGVMVWVETDGTVYWAVPTISCRPIPTAPTATTTNTSTTARPITRSTRTLRSASNSPAIIPTSRGRRPRRRSRHGGSW